MAITLETLRSQVRSRTNMENSQFVTDDECDLYINQGYEELYDYLVNSFEDYSLTSQELTLGSGDILYFSPNLYKLRGVDKKISNNNWYSLQRFMFKDRNKYNNSPSILYENIYNNVQYNMEGDHIRFIPSEQAVGTYKIWYIPNITLLDGYVNVRSDLEKFVDYIITSASIKCLAKEESDVSVFGAQLEMIKQRITKMMTNRDDAIPKRVGSWQDAEYRGLGWWNR